MKKLLLLWMTALVVTVGLQAQRSYTFNAVALNVDGLPPTVMSVNVNADGPQESGSTTMGNNIAKFGWEIIALSEDFNYHNELVTPLANYYNSTPANTEITGAYTDTDGLGLLCSKTYTFQEIDKQAWSESDGNLTGNLSEDNGADEMINKGYRYFAVTIASGVVIDVYALHMDAASRQADIDVRNSQLTQLATALIENTKNNKRPVIVMGDTNCRYTREKVKELLIDVINAEDGLTIKDAWIELTRGGLYPQYYGDTSNALSTEIVDKIFYINTTASNLTLKANAYSASDKLEPTDHKPVVVNFTITDLNGTPATTSDWQVEGGEIVEIEGNVLDGEQVVNGTKYYVKNVETGLYLKSGAMWGTRACEGSAGMPIKFNLQNDGKYNLETLSGSISAVKDPYMDNLDNTTWTLEVVEGTEYQYYIKCNEGTLASSGDAGNPVYCKPFNSEDSKQKWILLTDERMKEEMTLATASKPFDITPMMVKAGDFDRMDFDKRDSGEKAGELFSTWATDNWPGFTFEVDWGGSDTGHNGYAVYNSTSAVTINQPTIANMPIGTYKVSFEGFYRARAQKNFWSSQTDYTMNVTANFGGTSKQLIQNTNTSIGADKETVNPLLRDNNTYNTEFSVTTSAISSLNFSLSKAEFNSGYSSKTSWVVIDNIVIKYLGDGTEEENTNEIKQSVANKINETANKVASLSPEAQAAYDITTILYRYNNDLLSSDGSVEIALINQAYEIAVLADKQATINNGDGDITSLIVNPSFEDGVNGWTIGWGAASMPNTDVNIATDGTDGSYLLNVYIADNNYVNAAAVNQILTGLPNGLYELKAQLTSFGPGEGDLASDATGNTVYIVGNGYHKGIVAETKTKFKEATVNFLVVDGTAKIGVVGGYNGIYYYPTSGCFYKADNFRLKYICDPAHGRVKLALDEAKAITLDQYGQNALDLSAYETAFENRTITGDGTTEAKAIYDALQTASKTQKTVNADMTYAITNPNFETGDYTGWVCSTGGDTQSALQENTDYSVAGANARYLFNTWNNNTAQPLTQTVTGLANGTYKLTAMVASDSGNNIQLTANGESTTVAAASAKSLAVFPSVTCEVTDGTLDIEVVGENNVWYKADDFRLTYLGRELTLNETDTSISYEDGWYTSVVLNRNVKANTWNTFVVPFNMEIPSGWTVKELSSATQVDDVISMTFSDASSIEAGTPYMVKTSSVWSGTTIENTDVTSVLNDVDGSGIVTFKGNYISGNVPTDAFFISGNKFYQAINENNTLKAFRGYFEVTGVAGVNVLNFTFDDEVTGIDTTVADPTAEVIAIYSLDGRRIESLQRGVNIVKLSNGKTKKLIVK